jgi:methylenetetrahydrofolate dehydrogenase (NADP+) / methenyltetrahydrofolate cyclohydrolase
MSGQIISGKAISETIKSELQAQVAKLVEQGIKPGLAVIIVGENPASQVYVRNKARTCIQLGMHSEIHELPESTSEEALLQLIADLNQNQSIHGILVQLPLPKHIHEQHVLDAIDPGKDVDGFHPVQVGNMVIGNRSYLPCTPNGVIELLKRSNIEIAGKHAVVVGRSNIVGKPVAMLLLRENATVTICHSRTADLAAITKQADILVVAIGRAEAITAEHIKPGAVVIDVGINRTEDGRLVGDVDFASAQAVSSHITPVPGGVGPMTITMLMFNTLDAARTLNGIV